MRLNVFATSVLAACLSLGCSTHPIPEDRIALTVYDIAQKIRCEAREVVVERTRTREIRSQIEELIIAESELKALAEVDRRISGRALPALLAEKDRLAKQENLITAKLNELRDKLKDYVAAVEKSADAVPKTRTEEASKDLTEFLKWRESRRKNRREIRQHLSRVSLFERDRVYRLQEIARTSADISSRFAVALKFLGHTFAYALRFEIEETNDLRVNTADFAKAVTLGTVTIGVAGGDKRKRKGKREVRVAANFRDLLELKKQCDESFFVDDGSLYTLRYPMRGRIGLDEVITQYLQISDEKFAFADTAIAGKTYSSVVTFTTTIDGGIKPAATLTRSSGDKFVGNSAFTAQREDIHEATIVLVPPAKPGSVEPDKITNVRIVNSSGLLGK